MGCFWWELVQYIESLMTSRAVSFWRIHALRICYSLTASRAARVCLSSIFFSSHLAKLECDECVLSSSLATAIVLYLSLFVSLSWVRYVMCRSVRVTVSVRVSYFYKSYLLTVEVKNSSMLRFEPPDLSRRLVQTCPEAFFNDWTFPSLREENSPTSLSEGDTLDLLTSCDSFLLSLNCFVDSHNGSPVMPADCHSWGTSVLV